MKTTLNVLKKSAFALVAGSMLSLSANAAGLSYAFDETFTDGSIAPGDSTFATLLFDDFETTGTVQLSIDVSADIGIADLTRLYLNLDPVLNSSELSFTRLSGSGSSAGETKIYNENDSFRAGGSGSYDVLFKFKNNTFNAGETLLYQIDGIDSLNVDSFDYLSVNAGGNGPFGAVAKFQSTGGGMGSAWATGDASGGFQPTVPEVPIPAAVWMLGSGLGFLAWKGRRSMAAGRAA